MPSSTGRISKDYRNSPVFGTRHFRRVRLLDPTPKWKGNYTRHSNGVFWDRSGHVYVNFAAVGFWEYGGPGGTLERVDEGKYTSVHKGESINPYGPGFVLVCSHGYNPKDSYQLLSWDGVTLETWASDGDVGACDWQQKGTAKLIFWKPRHNKILTVSEDGGKTMRQVVAKENIRNVGALGNGVLVYTMGGAADDPSFGIFRSADKGATWEKVFDGNMVGNVNCSPILSYDERAYLQTNKGLYKSSDRGKTWRLVETAPVFTFALQPGKDGDRHMTGLSREGVFETFDQGETWIKVAKAPPVPEKQKWLQSHDYYDFSWDFEDNVFYCSAPDSAWRYVRK
ncbi:MAG: WD40/YVTN/BNR-like repeat-containing protein [Candidatus Sumerlaeota bacterium]